MAFGRGNSDITPLDTTPPIAHKRENTVRRIVLSTALIAVTPFTVLTASISDSDIPNIKIDIG